MASSVGQTVAEREVDTRSTRSPEVSAGEEEEDAMK
jgi:hypothetical protein